MIKRIFHPVINNDNKNVKNNFLSDEAKSIKIIICEFLFLKIIKMMLSKINQVGNYDQETKKILN